MRKQEKYLNTQLYSECQLVTAINAYYCLTGKTIKQDSDEYEKLVDLCKTRYGSAVRIDKVHKKLGIRIIGYSDHISTGFPNKWYRINTIIRRKKDIYPKPTQKNLYFININYQK